MKDSSANQRRFDGIRVAHVAALLDVLKLSGDKGHARRRYSERAPQFEAVLDFAIQLKLVYKLGEILSVNDSLQRKTNALRDIINEQLFRCRTEYRREIRRFLRSFSPAEEDHVVYYPSPERRSFDSDIRNCLIDFGIISHDPERDRYIVEDLAVYRKAILTKVRRSLTQFHVQQQARDELGYSAEQEILRYERERIGPEYGSKLLHVSPEDNGAGFDIESITILPSGSICPRFIEVKAVSSRTFEFFWTSNEISVARLLGTWYYLYLLPVDDTGRFATDSLRIISNPAVSVLKSPQQWNVEPSILRCSSVESFLAWNPL